jgi:NitT/TauT family transport system permease protein/taurine transport system permease protein
MGDGESVIAAGSERRGASLSPNVWRLARRNLGALLWIAAPFVTLLIAWQVLVSAELVPPIWLPAPLVVWSTLTTMVGSGGFLNQIWISVGRLLLALVASSVTGIALGAIMGTHRTIAEFMSPLVTFMNALAGILWVPLAILWFGVGSFTVEFLIWNSMFFLILHNTLVGIRSVPSIYEAAIRTLGGGRWAVMRDVLIPGALPNIVTGLRVGMAFGWRALIAAELFAASSGLGFTVYKASYQFRSDVIIVALITIGIVGLCIDRLVFMPFEKATIRRWGLVVERADGGRG